MYEYWLTTPLFCAILAFAGRRDSFGSRALGLGRQAEGVFAVLGQAGRDHGKEEEIVVMKNADTSSSKIRDMVYISIFAVLIAVCSWISIPATVPFTLQTFGVFMAVGVLGGKNGTLAVLIYILLGAIGVPVFSGFKGGLGALLGTTGGYIVGFLFVALVMWALESAWGTGKLKSLVDMVIGLIICYAFGTAWFMFVYSRANGAVSLMTVLSWCVIPFIIPDLCKIALAFLLSSRVKVLLKKI